MASFLRKVARILSPGIPSAALPGGGSPLKLVTEPHEQLKELVSVRPKEDVDFARDVAPYALAAYGAVYGAPALGISSGAGGALAGYRAGLAVQSGNAGGLVSLFDMGGGNGANIWSTIGSLGSQYLSQRAAQSSGGIMQTMGALPPLARLGTAVGPVVAAGGALVARSATAAMRGAITWCRRNPAWCANVGGTAAVAAMISSGQIPAPRRRRGRGISSRDLRSYRRVHNLLAGFCAPKARIKRKC